jgi:ankyrin repeat protein
MEYLNERGAVSTSEVYAAADDLVLFCELGNVARAKALLESGVSAAVEGKMRGMPLVSALSTDPVKYEMVKILLENGADPNLNDRSGQNALISFFYNVFSPKIDEFNEKFMGERNWLEQAGIYAKPDYVGIKKQFAEGSFDTGLNEDFFKIIELLKKAGADFSVCDKSGNNILHLAAMGGAGIKVIKMLSENGVDMNAKTPAGYKPVDFILIGKSSSDELQGSLKELAIDLSDNTAENIDLAYKLIRHGLFAVEVFDLVGSAAAGLVNQSGRTFFHAAAGNPAIDNAALASIFSRGYRINAQDTHGQTPFMAAILADNGRNGRVKWMLERNPDLMATDCEGRIILHYFAMNEQAEIPEKLENIDRLVDSRNSDGETPLMTAAKNGQVGAIYRLVRAGAEIMIEDHDKKTALDHDSNGSIFKCCLNDYRHPRSSGNEAVKDLTVFQYFQLRCMPKAEAAGSDVSRETTEFAGKISSYIKRHELQKYVDESFAEKPLQN